MPRKTFFSFTLAAVLLSSAAASPQTIHYTSRGKQVSLTPIEKQYVVGMNRNADVSGSGHELRLMTVPNAGSVSPLGKNIFIVTASESRGAQSRSVGASPNFQSSLKAVDDADFVYPVYRYLNSGTLVYPQPEVVVKIKAGTDIFRIAQRYGCSVLRPLLFTTDQYILRIPSSQNPFELSDRINNDADVVWANPNVIQQRKKHFAPNDPLYPQQWHLNNTGQGGGKPGADISAEAAWDLHQARADVVIAVVDDAVDIQHPDLNIYVNTQEANGQPGVDDDGNGLIDDVNGWDFGGDDNDPSPPTADHAHGTSVAGVAAAVGNNNEGVVGAAFGATVLPVRISFGEEAVTRQDGEFEVEEAAIAEALRYAGQYADVINNSWGGPELSDIVADAITEAASVNGKRGDLRIPVLFASGNSATSFLTYDSDDIIPAGQYTISFVYEKDESDSDYEDTVWIESASLIDLDTDEALDGLYPFEPSFPDGASGSGNAPFEIVPSPLTETGFVFQSGDIGNNQTSVLTWQVDIDFDAYLTFNFRTSTEDGFDVLYVLLDGEDFPGSAYAADTQDPEFEPDTFLSYPFSGEVAENLFPMAGETLHPDVINIGASSDVDYRSAYSQWGDQMHFLAPSDGGVEGITTTDVTGFGMGYDPDSDYTLTEDSKFGGTSSACPLASGVVAMVISANPTLSKDEIVELLKETAVKTGDLPYDSNGFNPQYGYGRLDMAAAVQKALETAPVGVNEWALY